MTEEDKTKDNRDEDCMTLINLKEKPDVIIITGSNNNHRGVNYE